jgi:hypothetical protein
LTINDEKAVTGAAVVVTHRVAEHQRKLVDQAIISFLALTIGKNLVTDES